jgi:hypothetical protein
VLLRLAYLGVPNVFAMLRLLPVSDRDKDAEILALRHQITVLERQLGNNRPRFAASDGAFLAALPHSLPSDVLRAGCGCWCDRTQSCAGTATSSHAAMLPPPSRSARDDPARSAPSGP